MQRFTDTNILNILYILRLHYLNTHTLRGTAAANSFIYHTLTSDTVRLCPHSWQKCKILVCFVFEICSNLWSNAMCVCVYVCVEQVRLVFLFNPNTLD